MLVNYVIRSTAAFGGAPFRLKKCTALTSAAGGALDELYACAMQCNRLSIQIADFIADLKFDDSK